MSRIPGQRFMPGQLRDGLPCLKDLQRPSMSKTPPDSLLFLENLFAAFYVQKVIRCSFRRLATDVFSVYKTFLSMSKRLQTVFYVQRTSRRSLSRRLPDGLLCLEYPQSSMPRKLPDGFLNLEDFQLFSCGQKISKQSSMSRRYPDGQLKLETSTRSYLSKRLPVGLSIEKTSMPRRPPE